MKAIHFVQKDKQLLPKPLRPGSSIYESGYWAVSVEDGHALIGGMIYFHEKQKAPAFFGGKITACRVQPDGEWQGRLVFQFEASGACRGIRAPENWNWEQQIV